MCSHSNNKGLFLKLTPPLKEKKHTSNFTPTKNAKLGLWAIMIQAHAIPRPKEDYRLGPTVSQPTDHNPTTWLHPYQSHQGPVHSWLVPKGAPGLQQKVATKHKNPQNPFPQRYWHYLTVLSYREIPWRPQGRKNKKNVSSVASTRRTFSSPGQCLFQKGHGLGKWILEFVHDWSSP